MKFGYCANLNFLLNGDEESRKIFYAVLDAGYDYLETQLSNIPLLTPSQRNKFDADLRSAGVPCRVNLLLFPNDLTLVGSGLNLEDIAAHANKVLPIAAELGSELVVFGSGGTRRVPEGMDKEAVRTQLIDVLKTVAPIAERIGINIAIEPVCQRETNMINSYHEAVAMARAVGSPRIGAVIDWYHVAADGQSPAIFEEDKPKLFHVHVARPNGRLVPSPEDDPSEYADFVRAVKAVGYNRRVSIEAGIPIGADVAKTVRNGLSALKCLFA